MTARNTYHQLNSGNQKVPYIFLVPFFSALILFWGIPLFYGFSLSLFSDNLFGESKFVGFSHYDTVLRDPRYYHALGNTCLYTLLILFTIIPFALFLALVLQSLYSKIRGTLIFLLLLPGLTPPTVLGFLFLLVFNGRHGMLNNIFIHPWGFETIDWIKDPSFIKISLWLQALWRWTGFITLFLLAGLEGIPKTYYQLAQIEGANQWQTIRQVVVPLLRNTFIFTAVVLFLDAFVLFQGAYVLLGSSGGTGDAGLLLVAYTYFTGFTLGKFGTAAAMGFTLVPLLTGVLFLILFGWKTQKNFWKAGNAP